MVFASLDSYQADQSSSSSLLAQAIDTVRDWFESMQIFIENGLVRLQDLVARKVTVEQLCVGQTCVTENQLQQLLENNQIDSSVNSSETTSTATESEVESVPDTTAPIITLNGSDTIEIEKGSGWVDPGATVADPANGDQPENTNLSIYYSVGGVATGNEGRDLPQTVIDTNQAGSHTITYTASDSAGNIGTAERTLNVVDPTPMPEPTPEPISEPTPEPDTEPTS